MSKLRVTKEVIKYQRGHMGRTSSIPKKTTVQPAANLPHSFKNPMQYWADPWDRMSDGEQSWMRCYGFLINEEETEEAPAGTLPFLIRVTDRFGRDHFIKSAQWQRKKAVLYARFNIDGSECLDRDGLHLQIHKSNIRKVHLDPTETTEGKD